MITDAVSDGGRHKVNKDKEAQPNSSPSTSTSGRVWHLDGFEMLYLAQLPDELVEQLTSEEYVMLAPEDPQQWPQSLKDKMAPFADDDLLELT